MTFPVLNHAAKVMFLVSGSTAADALAQVLFGPLLPVSLPAQGVAPGILRLLWLVDRKAAACRCETKRVWSLSFELTNFWSNAPESQSVYQATFDRMT